MILFCTYLERQWLTDMRQKLSARNIRWFFLNVQRTHSLLSIKTIRVLSRVSVYRIVMVCSIYDSWFILTDEQIHRIPSSPMSEATKSLKCTWESEIRMWMWACVFAIMYICYNTLVNQTRCYVPSPEWRRHNVQFTDSCTLRSCVCMALTCS